jgi:hypothetical protein
VSGRQGEYENSRAGAFGKQAARAEQPIQILRLFDDEATDVITGARAACVLGRSSPSSRSEFPTSNIVGLPSAPTDRTRWAA